MPPCRLCANSCCPLHDDRCPPSPVDNSLRKPPGENARCTSPDGGPASTECGQPCGQLLFSTCPSPHSAHLSTDSCGQVWTTFEKTGTFTPSGVDALCTRRRHPQGGAFAAVVVHHPCTPPPRPLTSHDDCSSTASTPPTTTKRSIHQPSAPTTTLLSPTPRRARSTPEAAAVLPALDRVPHRLPVH